MDEERDLVVFEDDAGNELTMEVLDYLAYEGKEYALLTEYVEDEDDADEDEPVEVFIMEVRPVGDDQDHAVCVMDLFQQGQLHTVFPPCLGGVSLGIDDDGPDAVFLQALDNVDDLAVAGVGAVLLEGQA